MLNFLKWIFGLFSPYVNSFERKVDCFFKNIKSTDSISDIRQELLNLMQENLIVVNVWMEKKYKGYTYLSKSVRREMYENSAKIVQLFLAHCSSFQPKDNDVKKNLDEKGMVFPDGGNEMIRYLLQIMTFLQPEKYYHYIKSASFGKLLRDPEKAKLEGDCNQIVTFYAYLFSLKFPIDELKIKLLPEHVCLHFRGVDIEATNGTFQKYKDSEQIIPVTEIISTNLLDIVDFREELQSVSARDFVKSAQLAYAISSLKPLVAKNLNAAYYNLGVAAMNSNDFETAIFYLSKTTDDPSALKTAYRNGAVYYLKQNNFEKASYYAGLSGDSEIVKTVKKNELVHRYNQLAEKVRGVKTLADAKKYKSTYQEMLRFAQQIGDSSLVGGVEETLRKVSL